jgi:predicted nucleotidyltransferase
MSEYVSIKNEVVKKLEEHLPEIRERFGIEMLGVFGSVSRGEDKPDSDIDIL